MKKKNIILYVGLATKEAIESLKKRTKKEYRFMLLTDLQTPKEKIKKYKSYFDIVEICDLKSSESIAEKIFPYEDELLVATCRSEAKIPEFARVVPHIPYLRTPTSESLRWSVNKIHMRKRFRLYNPKIGPKYMMVMDHSDKTIEAIKEKVGFPLVVKPAGLAQSLLVTICYHEEELQKSLKKIFREVDKLHQEYKGEDIEKIPKVLVEQFMEGDMYSIDGYVNSRGKIYFCPLVKIKTGRDIGFDDFFGYQQITPVNLDASQIKKAEQVAIEATHALGLRSTSIHIEFIKTARDWKVIEVGPRIGGFRDTLYNTSYGIQHGLNDILVRIPQKPIIPKKVLGHSVAMKFFAKKEGILTSIIGIKKAQKLESFYSIDINKKVGDKAIFAKNGGKSIFNIILFNRERSQLLADIRRLEKMINITTL